MDEQPMQLLKETRQPIPGTKTHANRAILSMNERGLPAFLCSPNHSPDGEK